MKLTVTKLLLLLLSASVLWSFRISHVKASGVIYIRADGSIDPLTANITSTDNITYTFTDNNYDSIVVERDNIVLNGQNFLLQGTGSGCGMNMTDRNNVTIKYMEVKAFELGILLFQSSNCTVSQNSITNNSFGIPLLDSNYNNVNGNSIANNTNGIWLEATSSYNIISGNNITNNNSNGITVLYDSSYNIISGNNIANNGDGMFLKETSNNIIYHNNFIDNPVNSIYPSLPNVWDNGYPSGGNYWSDYTGVDSDGDGLGDTPYILDEQNQDNYPLMQVIPEYPSTFILLLFMLTTLLVSISYRRKLGKT